MFYAVVAPASTLEEAIDNVPHGTESIAAIKWFIFAAAAITCIVCCLASSRYFSDGDYRRGNLALIGAVIAGIAPNVARLLLY